MSTTVTLPVGALPGGGGGGSGITSINGNSNAAQTIAAGTGISVSSGGGTTTISNTGLTTSLTDSHILVGNGSNVATDVAASGDLTLANTGAFTIANLAVTNAKIANSTIDLTAKVTGTLPVTNGGSGNSSLTTYSVLCGGTTSTGAMQQVSGVGTSGQVLTSNGAGALPTWQAAGGGGSTPVVNSGLRGLGTTSDVKYKRAFTSGLASGNNIVYTAPANTRAYINAFGVYNTSGSAVSFYPTWVIGGTHYKFNTTLSCGANAANQVATSVVIILEPGESFGINAATGSVLNGFARVVEYPSTTPVYAAKKFSSWTNGNNTLYTVPANTNAILIDGVGMTAQNVTSLNYYNSSGGSVTVTYHNVASGNSVSSAYQISAATAVGNDAKSVVVISHTLSSGDFININVNSSTDTQLAWLMVQELPN